MCDHEQIDILEVSVLRRKAHERGASVAIYPHNRPPTQQQQQNRPSHGNPRNEAHGCKPATSCCRCAPSISISLHTATMPRFHSAKSKAATWVRKRTIGRRKVRRSNSLVDLFRLSPIESLPEEFVPPLSLLRLFVPLCDRVFLVHSRAWLYSNACA
jgi:hypothetical protein